MTERELHNPYRFPNLWLTKDNYPLSYDGFSSLIRRAKKATGLDFHAHMLRHTFASIMAEMGIDPFMLKELMGHQDITTTQRYVHQNQATLASAHSERSPLGSLPLSTRLRRRPGRPVQK